MTSNMADTVQIITLPRAEADWLFHAIRNVQTRSHDETTSRDAIRQRLTDLLLTAEKNFAIALTPLAAKVCLWATQEARTRSTDEWLMRSRLLRLFVGLTGDKGVDCG